MTNPPDIVPYRCSACAREFHRAKGDEEAVPCPYYDCKGWAKPVPEPKDLLDFHERRLPR